MDKFLVEKDSYFDSVFLMLINSEIKERQGVGDAVVAMGTEMNLKLLSDMKLWDSRLEEAGANDLIIAVRGDDEAALQEAIEHAKKLLSQKSSKSEGQAYTPRSLQSALREKPESNLALISLPGQYTGREARRALESGLHVMLFSDNVTLEEEIELKELAVQKGLLMMGPDCGTAIINGIPLCFANVVRRGKIGIAAASGTGLQEVSCLVDSFGAGVSQAIGTGGRDLKNKAVGGRMMLQAIEALKDDPETEVIVVISKPPAPEVADTVLASLKKSEKPAVIHFIGLQAKKDEANLHFAGNLEETAGIAAAIEKGETWQARSYSLPADQVKNIVARETAELSSRQKYLRGLYTGGTLADEALILLEQQLGRVFSNNQSKPELQLKDPHASQEHTIVDLGDDIYTRGRAHPMIDPTTRVDRIRREAEDPEVALLLLDIVLGYGSHEDPAGAILDDLRRAKAAAKERGGYLPVIASVTGTPGDFQGYQNTVKKLESIGCIVMPSNYQASLLALDMLSERAGKKGK